MPDRETESERAMRSRTVAGHAQIMSPIAVDLRGRVALEVEATMVWDFGEANILGESVGAWQTCLDYLVDSFEIALPRGQVPVGSASQFDTSRAIPETPPALVVTDPPYYDNIGYADLSDFFYIWLRRSLSAIYPTLFSTLLTPKQPELVATPYRFGGDKRAAERHFEEGLGKAVAVMEARAAPEYPFTLYYAFKQTDSGTPDVGAPGWHTMLKGLVDRNLQVIGTWPMRTEQQFRSVSMGTNALASSILIACRPRGDQAPETTFRAFQRELSDGMPPALSVMTGRDRGTSEPWVDPIDLRQAAIGPGMAVYTRYSRVQKATGEQLTVPEALQEINEAVDRYFEEAEGTLDPASRFCVQWYQGYAFENGPFGRAEVLAKAMGALPDSLAARSLIDSRAGNVALVRPNRYPSEISPGPSAWELCHRLVHTLQTDGEGSAALLYNRMPGLAEEARDLAYRLYLEAERKSRADDALGYNALVASWTDVRKRAAEVKQATQAPLPRS